MFRFTLRRRPKGVCKLFWSIVTRSVGLFIERVVTRPRSLSDMEKNSIARQLQETCLSESLRKESELQFVIERRYGLEQKSESEEEQSDSTDAPTALEGIELFDQYSDFEISHADLGDGPTLILRFRDKDGNRYEGEILLSRFYQVGRAAGVPKKPKRFIRS